MSDPNTSSVPVPPPPGPEGTPPPYGPSPYAPSPSDGSTAPAHGTPAPGHGDPAPAYGTPSGPAYGTPSGPAYGTAPDPVYGGSPSAPAYGATTGPAYAAPGYGQAYVPARYNPMAIAAFVTALLGFAIVPVVLGHVAQGQIRRTGEQGGWMAVVGLVLGYLACLLYVVLFIAFGSALLWGARV